MFFVFLLYISRGWVESKADIPEDVHIGLQNELKRIIGEYIQQNLETSTNLQFETFYTEPLNKQRVRATFVYSFDDSGQGSGPAQVRISGLAVLNRKASETPGESVWSFDELKILDNQINFKDGITINPNQMEESIPPTENLPPEKRGAAEETHSKHE